MRGQRVLNLFLPAVPNGCFCADCRLSAHLFRLIHDEYPAARVSSAARVNGLATGCAGHEDGQDRHLIEQPMLGRCGSGTGWPARVSSMAARSSSPVTGLPLPGVDWSNAPR